MHIWLLAISKCLACKVCCEFKICVFEYIDFSQAMTEAAAKKREVATAALKMPPRKRVKVGNSYLLADTTDGGLADAEGGGNVVEGVGWTVEELWKQVGLNLGSEGNAGVLDELAQEIILKPSAVIQIVIAELMPVLDALASELEDKNLFQ